MAVSGGEPASTWEFRTRVRPTSWLCLAEPFVVNGATSARLVPSSLIGLDALKARSLVMNAAASQMGGTFTKDFGSSSDALTVKFGLADLPLFQLFLIFTPGLTLIWILRSEVGW